MSNAVCDCLQSEGASPDDCIWLSSRDVKRLVEPCRSEVLTILQRMKCTSRREKEDHKSTLCSILQWHFEWWKLNQVLHSLGVSWTLMDSCKLTHATERQASDITMYSDHFDALFQLVDDLISLNRYGSAYPIFAHLVKRPRGDFLMRQPTWRIFIRWAKAVQREPKPTTQDETPKDNEERVVERLQALEAFRNQLWCISAETASPVSLPAIPIPAWLPSQSSAPQATPAKPDVLIRLSGFSLTADDLDSLSSHTVLTPSLVDFMGHMLWRSTLMKVLRQSNRLWRSRLLWLPCEFAKTVQKSRLSKSACNAQLHKVLDAAIETQTYFHDNLEVEQKLNSTDATMTHVSHFERVLLPLYLSKYNRWLLLMYRPGVRSITLYDSAPDSVSRNAAHLVALRLAEFFGELPSSEPVYDGQKRPYLRLVENAPNTPPVSVFFDLAYPQTNFKPNSGVYLLHTAARNFYGVLSIDPNEFNKDMVKGFRATWSSHLESTSSILPLLRKEREALQPAASTESTLPTTTTLSSTPATTPAAASIFASASVSSTTANGLDHDAREKRKATSEAKRRAHIHSSHLNLDSDLMDVNPMEVSVRPPRNNGTRLYIDRPVASIAPAALAAADSPASSASPPSPASPSLASLPSPAPLSPAAPFAALSSAVAVPEVQLQVIAAVAAAAAPRVAPATLAAIPITPALFAAPVPQAASQSSHESTQSSSHTPVHSARPAVEILSSVAQESMLHLAQPQQPRYVAQQPTSMSQVTHAASSSSSSILHPAAFHSATFARKRKAEDDDSCSDDSSISDFDEPIAVQRPRESNSSTSNSHMAATLMRSDSLMFAGQEATGTADADLMSDEEDYADEEPQPQPQQREQQMHTAVQAHVHQPKKKARPTPDFSSSSSSSNSSSRNTTGLSSSNSSFVPPTEEELGGALHSFAVQASSESIVLLEKSTRRQRHADLRVKKISDAPAILLPQIGGDTVGSLSAAQFVSAVHSFGQGQRKSGYEANQSLIHNGLDAASKAAQLLYKSYSAIGTPGLNPPDLLNESMIHLTRLRLALWHMYGVRPNFSKSPIYELLLRVRNRYGRPNEKDFSDFAEVNHYCGRLRNVPVYIDFLEALFRKYNWSGFNKSWLDILNQMLPTFEKEVEKQIGPVSEKVISKTVVDIWNTVLIDRPVVQWTGITLRQSLTEAMLVKRAYPHNPPNQTKQRRTTPPVVTAETYLRYYPPSTSSRRSATNTASVTVSENGSHLRPAPAAAAATTATPDAAEMFLFRM